MSTPQRPFSRCRHTSLLKAVIYYYPASIFTYYNTGNFDAETWQQAEDELWDVLNRRRVPSYDEGRA